MPWKEYRCASAADVIQEAHSVLAQTQSDIGTDDAASLSDENELDVQEEQLSRWDCLRRSAALGLPPPAPCEYSAPPQPRQKRKRKQKPNGTATASEQSLRVHGMQYTPHHVGESSVSYEHSDPAPKLVHPQYRWDATFTEDACNLFSSSAEEELTDSSPSDTVTAFQGSCYLNCESEENKQALLSVLTLEPDLAAASSSSGQGFKISSNKKQTEQASNNWSAQRAHQTTNEQSESKICTHGFNLSDVTVGLSTGVAPSRCLQEHREVSSLPNAQTNIDSKTFKDHNTLAMPHSAKQEESETGLASNHSPEAQHSKVLSMRALFAWIEAMTFEEVANTKARARRAQRLAASALRSMHDAKESTKAFVRGADWRRRAHWALGQWSCFKYQSSEKLACARATLWATRLHKAIGAWNAIAGEERNERERRLNEEKTERAHAHARSKNMQKALSEWRECASRMRHKREVAEATEKERVQRQAAVSEFLQRRRAQQWQAPASKNAEPRHDKQVQLHQTPHSNRQKLKCKQHQASDPDGGSADVIEKPGKSEQSFAIQCGKQTGRRVAMEHHIECPAPTETEMNAAIKEQRRAEAERMKASIARKRANDEKLSIEKQRMELARSHYRVHLCSARVLRPWNQVAVTAALRRSKAMQKWQLRMKHKSMRAFKETAIPRLWIGILSELRRTVQARILAARRVQKLCIRILDRACSARRIAANTRAHRALVYLQVSVIVMRSESEKASQHARIQALRRCLLGWGNRAEHGMQAAREAADAFWTKWIQRRCIQAWNERARVSQSEREAERARQRRREKGVGYLHEVHTLKESRNPRRLNRDECIEQLVAKFTL